MTEPNPDQRVKIEIECSVYTGDGPLRLVPSGGIWETWLEHAFCIHGEKMRWSCDECNEYFRKQDLKNLYDPHPFMVSPGEFWRCIHGSTGFDGDLNWIGCEECRKTDPEKARKWEEELNKAHRTIPLWWDSSRHQSKT